MAHNQLFVFAGIKSFLTLSRYRPVIRSLNDLTETSEYSFVVKKHSSVWSNMIVRITSLFTAIRLKL